ncbi:DUF3320 domain-containing protein [Methanobrevibacter sp.]
MFKGVNVKKSSSKKIEKEFKDLRKNLLDLTLRNQLLNFKDRAQTLTISNQTPKNMYNLLVLQNKAMKFISNQEKNAEEESSRFGFIKPSINHFTHDDSKLEVNLTEKGLQKKLFYINNQSKTMLEEQGYNILYMAIGFLKWIDKSKPKKTNLAPLILIPVTMHRKQIGNSFTISWTGEDIQTNISLKTKLAEDGIVIPNFEAANFIEAPDHYIRSVSEAVHKMRNWEVTNKVALGFFSFTKFIMYNDLNPQSWEDNVDLTNHPLIQAIFDPSSNDTHEFKEEEVDEKISYRDMYQVLDADSSQIAVIEDVKAERNLVVEGPPGTGKSQTIVNLIAELLAEDKTVLFVSEKMAALEVVKSRLASVGLGKFVLELHSHKTRRKKFLKELQKSANVRSTNDLDINRTLRKLETLKIQLDDYAELIHKPLYAVQLSAFDLYGKKEFAEEYFQSQSKILPLVRFENAEDLTMKDLDDIIISLENLSELNGTINRENPWNYCSPNSLLPSDLREIEMLISDSSRALDDFKVEAEIVEDKYGIKQPKNLKSYNETIKALDFLDGDYPLVDKQLLLSPAWDNPKGALKLIEDLEKYQKLKKAFDMKFDESILTEDIDRLISELEELQHKRFSFFSKSNKKEISSYYKVKVPKDSEIINDLENVKKFKTLSILMESEKEAGFKYFSSAWNLSQSPNELKKIYNWMFELKRLFQLEIFNEKIYDYISNDFKVEPIRNLLKDFISQGENFKKELNKLQSKLRPNTRQIFRMEAEDVPFDDWIKQFNKWNGHFSSLHLWSQYLQAKEDCKGTEANLFINTIEKRNIKMDEVKPLVLGNFADSLLNKLFIDNPELNAFVGELHENRIKEFKDLDRKILELNQKRVFNKLNRKIPKIYGQADNEEARILAGEFTRKSGHLPVRKLLEKAGDVIKQIKPIFMMSPLSIAQYLDPTNPKLQFDVVIFDEASQVKPEDALGAFMRGKTAVVMGDTQQLPPTSFFDQIVEGESHEEVAGALDMESILHLCKMSFPVKMLKWHYRSRHESLIAVSNREFYDNNLLVYPSPSHDNPELGLKFKYCPDTVYERGEGSYNKGEAREVVEAIFEHFEKYGDSKSLGVGTFSVAQRNAILEELERERRLHPELEPLFAENREDRFFVKNLETIQGDERDVILISVGYGFDQNRKMSLNFGPLNQDGGERRLNVLVTRAKEKCVVFSNFRSHDIQLTANPPFGVRALKEFLEYAENLTMGNIPTFDEAIEPFDEAIYTYLIESGYTVDKHIGCAGFRVDLAIVDDDNPGRYILGITTDGKMYSSSKVARDRDRLREQVLEGLGWKLYHLWSTDWYRNREVSKERLIQAIEQSKRDIIKDDEKREEEERKFKAKMEAEKQKRLEELKKAEEEEKRKKEEAKKQKEQEELEKLNKEKEENDDNEEDIAVVVSSTSHEDNSSKIDSSTSDKSNDDLIEDSGEDIDNKSDNDNEDISSKEKRSKELIDQFSDGNENNERTTYDQKESSGGIINKIFSSGKNKSNSHEDNELEEINAVDEKMIKELKKEADAETDIVNGKSSNMRKSHSSDNSRNSDNDNINSTKNKPNSDNLKSNEDNLKSNSDNFKSDSDNLKSNPAKNNKNNFQSSENTDTINSYDKEDNKSSSDVIKNIGSFIESKLSSIKSKDKTKSNNDIQTSENENNSYPTADISLDDNSINNEDILNNEYSNKSRSNDTNSSHENKSQISNEKVKKDNNKNSNAVKILGSDDIYEYVEVPIDRELKEGEELIEYINDDNEEYEIVEVPIDKELKEGEKLIEPINEDNEEYEIVEVPIDKELSENEELIGYVERNTDKDEITDNEDEIKDLKKNIEENNDIGDLKTADNSNDMSDEDLNNVITSIINPNSSEDNPINTYVEIHESNPAVNDNHDLNILNDMDLNENNDPPYQNNKDTIKTIENNDDTDRYSSENEQIINENPDDNLNHGIEIDENSNIDEDFITISDVNSPLKKNNLYYNRNTKNDTIFDRISNVKKELEYINNSLKEIENPTPTEVVHVIDRISDDLSEMEKNIEESDEGVIETVNLRDDSIEDSKVLETQETNISSDKISSDDNIFDEYINDSDILNNQTDEYVTDSTVIDKEDLDNIKKSQHSESDFEELENIIEDFDHQYKEIEKRRFNENNQLKTHDTRKLPKKGKTMKDYIKPYVEVVDLDLNKPEDVYDKALSYLAEQILKIVETEGPVHKDIVIKRIKEQSGIKRASSKLKTTVEDGISYGETNGLITVIDQFLYSQDLNSEVEIRERVKPNIDYICNDEIIANIKLVLLFKEHLSIDNLTKAVARNFGFKSTSKKTSAKINNVIDLMLAESVIENINGEIQLKN